MEISIPIALTLITSGVIVGFVNTLAGGATVISMTIFMVLGLPITVANGTNRVAVILQNLTSSLNFRKNNLLDVKMGLKLSIPTIIGSVIGSQIAVEINENTFRICLGAILFMVLAFMIFSPAKIFKGENRPMVNKPNWKVYFWFLIAGFYSGYIYVGLGYIILTIAMLNMNYDIIRANALKGFIVLISTPFALAVFMMNGQVCYLYGLIHAVGNIIGAYLASQYGIGMGIKFIRILLIAFILFTIADMFGLISIKELVWSMLDKF